MALFFRKQKDVKEDKPKASQVKAVPITEKTSMKDLYAAAEVKTPVKAKDGKKEEKKIKFASAYKILIKPLVTEKVSNLGALNKYVFAVNINANKVEIAKAMHSVYGVKPLAVNILKVKGKESGYGRISGRRKDWKKAVVTLPEGQTIKVYEGV